MRLGQHGRHNPAPRNPLVDQVDHAERDSNAFRSFFERWYREHGHRSRQMPELGHKHHAGFEGDVTLKDEIQNVDESFERLRKEIDVRGGVTPYAVGQMHDAVEHATEVDRIIGGPDRRDRTYDDLAAQWNLLKARINDMADIFKVPRVPVEPSSGG